MIWSWFHPEFHLPVTVNTKFSHSYWNGFRVRIEIVICDFIDDLQIESHMARVNLFSFRYSMVDVDSHSLQGSRNEGKLLKSFSSEGRSPTSKFGLEKFTLDVLINLHIFAWGKSLNPVLSFFYNQRLIILPKKRSIHQHLERPISPSMMLDSVRSHSTVRWTLSPFH